MGDVLNLRRWRKARERAEKAQAAEANRIGFGRTKAERRASEAQNDLERARLDAHRREPASHEATIEEPAETRDRPAPAPDA